MWCAVAKQSPGISHIIPMYAVTLWIICKALVYRTHIFITRDSEVIMFSPCVFVCLFVCVYVCHDVCPDDLTMKDWCHTNNILQVRCWGCLVVQVMFHTLMTSLVTSQDHKVGQILKLIYLRQYFSYSVDQKLKMSEMLLAIILVYSTSGITSGKKNCHVLKMAAIFKYQTQLQSDLTYENIVPNHAKKVFLMVMTSSMTSQVGLKVSLYIHVWERLAPGANCKGNVSSINKCQYHKCLSRLYMPKNDLNE